MATEKVEATSSVVRPVQGINEVMMTPMHKGLVSSSAESKEDSSESKKVEMGDAKSSSDSSGDSTKELVDVVKTELLGNEPSIGFKKFFYNVDVFSSEQSVRAPKYYNVVNAYFTMMYYLFLLAFSIYTIYSFVHQVPVETNTMVKSQDLQPIHIRVNMSCSISYGCGNWTTSAPYELKNNITIIANWAVAGSDCSQTPAKTVINIDAAAGPHMSYTADFEVCYSQSTKDFVQIVVPYSNNYYKTNPIYNIDFYGNPDKYSNNMYFDAPLRPLEWKTVYFSQTEYINTKSEVTYEPYVADLFYNGHSYHNDVAILTFKVQQFSYSSAKTNQISIYGALGSIGGFSWTCNSLLGAVKNIGLGITNFIYAFQKSESATIVSFLTMLYIFILKSMGQMA